MPSNHLPLTIIPPKLPSFEKAKKPKDWNPQVYDTKSIDATKHKRMFTESKIQSSPEIEDAPEHSDFEERSVRVSVDEMSHNE